MQAVSKKTQEVITDMADRYSNRYIARSLGLSAPTVKKYLDENKQ